MVKDRIEKIGKCYLQHGPLSDRVYLMHLGSGEAAAIIAAMLQLAQANGYTKLVAKVPSNSAAAFKENGFTTEARIPDFYPDGDSALFVSRFFSKPRSRCSPADCDRMRRVLHAAQQRFNSGIKRPLPADCSIVPMTMDDAEQMAALYSRVFESYPFPIFDPDHLRATMEGSFRYVGIIRNGALVAVAGAEREACGTEMTDFATDREYRRTSLAAHLLSFMESEARRDGIKTAFTIARSLSFGINVMFSRGGYAFAGTLVNNTNISGRVQSMNVWYKFLGPG